MNTITDSITALLLLALAIKIAHNPNTALIKYNIATVFSVKIPFLKVYGEDAPLVRLCYGFTI